jgi:radical SAM superfamily enzyme YgiQ (UPF0313 family)
MPNFFLINLRFFNLAGYSDRPITFPHVGLICLKETAKSYNLDVRILDGDLHNMVDDEIFNEIVHAKPMLIGFSPFQNTMERTILMIKKISIELPDTIIVLGGVHASILASVILNDIPEIDYIIRGEAEESFPKLLLNIIAGEKNNFSEIDGLVYKENGKIIENKPTFCADLDLVPNLGIYQIPFTKSISLNSSRGCISNCSFCCTPFYMKLIGKNQWRYQSPNKVIKDIKEIIEISGDNKFIIDFIDSDFLSVVNKNTDRAEQIADILLSENIPIQIRISCQANGIVKAGVDFWKKWKKAGLNMIYCGFEAGSDEDLLYYNKSSKLTDALEAYKILEECNIYLNIGFIMFNPYSDKERILKNIKFLKTTKKLHIYGNISREVIPYPGTKIYNDLRKENFVRFEKEYLSTRIKYKNDFFESLRIEICSHGKSQMPIDLFCHKFDIAYYNYYKTVEFNKQIYELNSQVNANYFKYISLRSNCIESFVIKMLNSPYEKLSIIGNRMDNALLKLHKKFISEISEPDKSENNNKLFSIFSYFKKN